MFSSIVSNPVRATALVATFAAISFVPGTLFTFVGEYVAGEELRQPEALNGTLVAPVGGHMRDVRSVQRPAHVHRAPSRSGIGGGDK